MKKVCWLLILVLLLGCFAGCDTDKEENHTEPTKNEEYGEALTQSQKNDIIFAWSPTGDDMAFWGWMDDGTGLGRYYGTESGYAIVFIPTALPIETNIVIGEYAFSHPSGFALMAYRQGSFTKLNDIYEQGLISDDTIRAAWEKHNEIEEQLFPNRS